MTSRPAAAQSDRDGGAHRVVIVGGGVCGLETLLGLQHLAGDRVHLTLISSEPEFTYRPLEVEEPFGLGPAGRTDLALLCRELGADFLWQTVASVDGDGFVRLANDATASFDSLVLCPGARLRAAFDRALSFPGPGRRFTVDELLREATGSLRVAFVIPPGVTWSLPLYELALMTERRGRTDGGIQIECCIATPESAPLAMFGTAASTAVAELLDVRGIEILTGAYVRESETESLTVSPANRELEADIVVALPILDGPEIIGVPYDDNGFISIDQHARVAGTGGTYAAGDATNFPIKQGGLGTQQADAAAEHIAARAGADIEPAPFHPVLRGSLLTGPESLHMHHEIAGGAGEGEASSDYLWWPPHKIASRYLSAWLSDSYPREDPAPPVAPLDIEVALPSEWHRQPLALDPYAPLDSE
ncbi:MAG: FAD-dependent oxidoreductase [Solirubrobacterales bacterium]